MTSDEKAPHVRRVAFTRGVPVQILALDGSASWPCRMLDAGETGAKLQLGFAANRFTLTEFILLLSTTGTSARQCELVWANGDMIGVRFNKDNPSLPTRNDGCPEHFEI